MPDRSDSATGQDELSQFLAEAVAILCEAHLIAEAVPNVDVPAVERASRQLHAVRRVLQSVDDPYIPPEKVNQMISEITDLISYLEEAELRVSSQAAPGPSLVRDGSAHRPRYHLDLSRCAELHRLGNSWEDVADAMGVSRGTIYNHFRRSGLDTSRPAHATLDDDELDEYVSEISLEHPFVGQAIVMGHLAAAGLHVPRERIQASLRRVDALGVLIRWSGIIKRRVYRVRGANALWHQDGNEKLRPWGFYVHGCIDGHSRLLVFLVCSSNKRAETVTSAFKDAVAKFGWPSRVRGDFGKENNGIEVEMTEHWGSAHRAYLRGRSTQNVRMERTWRDIRKDTLEIFRLIFADLEEEGSLDVRNALHRACLFLVFQPRIQASLDRTRMAWNNHKIRTARNRTPLAIYALSKTKAINAGYWHSNPGDAAHLAEAGGYGEDPDAPSPPADELREDPPSLECQGDTAHHQASRQTDDEIAAAAATLREAGFDWLAEDDSWGTSVYKHAVHVLTSTLAGV